MRTILAWNDDWRMAGAPRALGDTGFALSHDRRDAVLADAIVFHVPTLDVASLPTGRRPGQRWVAWWLECEVRYPQVDDPAFMRVFDLTMSHRRPCDVWTPYATDAVALYAVPVPKVEDALAVYIASNAHDLSGRERYVAELAKHVGVDTFGRRPGQRRIPDDDGRPAKLRTIARYRFTLAFENAIARDYVTEKFFDALGAGSVPVVLGAPNVRDFAPSPRSYLDVADFPDPGALAARMRELAADEAAYASLLHWKRDAPTPAFRALIESGSSDAFERLARRL